MKRLTTGFVTTVFVALVLAAFSGALAQSLRSLLPADTVAAIGVQGLSGQQAKIQPFIDEFERLGVAKAFQDAFASTEKQAQKSAKLPDVGQMPAELKGLGALDILGNEAYLAVALRQGNPIPAVIFVANVDAKAQKAFSAMLAKEAAKPEVQKLTEGKVAFYVATVDNGNGTHHAVRLRAGRRARHRVEQPRRGARRAPPAARGQRALLHRQRGLQGHARRRRER